MIGDRFIRAELFQNALEQAFRRRSESLEFVVLSNEWPLEPFHHNDEVSEFVGDEEEICVAAGQVDVIVTQVAPITKRVLEAAERLKIVGCARGGPVNVNIQASTERGVPVVFAPGRNAQAVAEFTCGLILAEIRNICRANEDLLRKTWRGDLYCLENAGLELKNSIIGIVGFGNIGKKVVSQLKAFGAKVLVYDPFVSAVEVEALGCEFTSLDELLKKSDVVSLHARLSPETQGMFGGREFGLMKESAYFINTARGELVRYDDLYVALKEKKIAGAALDVFEAEPLPVDSPLYQLENLTVTPHIAGATRESAENGAYMVAEDIYLFMTGKVPRHCANPEVLAMAERRSS